MTEQERFADIQFDEDLDSPPETESLLAEEPLFAAMLRRAVGKIWGDDPVMTDFVDHVAQPLSDLLGNESAKGGNFVAEMEALGKDTARYSFDQSMRGHLINGLFPVLHIAKTLKDWEAPQFRFYDDQVRRLFIAGYILHDWLKLPGVEQELERAGFSHNDSIGAAQLPQVEEIFVSWAGQLGLEPFLTPIGGTQKVVQDLIYVACNTQIKWGTLRNLSQLPNLTVNRNKRGLCEQLSRLADYITYIARNPREVASDQSLRREISTLSNQAAVFTYHHLADNRGILTNYIHNAVINALRNEARVPILYAPSGVVYLTRKDAPAPPPVAQLVDSVVDTIKTVVSGKLKQSLDGFKRDGKGMKFADYYWDYFDAAALVQLGSRAVFKTIHQGKKPSSGKRFDKMRKGAWLPPTVDLDLPDDVRADQLAEWCYLAEKIVALKFGHVDTAIVLLKAMELSHLKADFDAVPRDNRAGGVGYHWYFAAGHYLKQHPGLEPAAWEERVETFAQVLVDALPETEPITDQTDQSDNWQDLRTYISATLTIGEAQSEQINRAAFAIELERYQNAKRKGRGKTSICAMCSASFEISKQQEAAVLFAPQVYSNKLSLHGSDALRNICAICGLETMLRQLLMNRSNASGGNFEGRRIRYLYFYPTYFFTPETLEVFRELYVRLRRLGFTELRRQLVRGQGLSSTVDLSPTTWQRLEPLLLAPDEETDPDSDRYIRMHFSEQEPATFYFLGVPPPGREAKEAEAWVHPAFLALVLPLCLDVKVVASESSIPLLIEADELPETVFLDGTHAFVGHLTRRERLNIDQILPALQRLAVAYLIQIDANSGMGRTGFDYRWQDIPAVARNLAASPLYAFHYLKKWQRKQELDTLPVGKAALYIDYVENYLERSNTMSHARELTQLYRQFYRAKKYNTNSIVRPISMASKIILEADSRLFPDQESMRELVFSDLQRRINKLQQDGLAFYPKGSSYESRTEAMEKFAAYLVDTIYYGLFRGDKSALRGKQLNLLSSACEAIYRQEAAKDRQERQELSTETE